MKIFKKGYLFNTFTSIIILVSFLITIKIDNDSRLPQNANTDYFMNSLPYIYLILICLIALITFNLYKAITTKKTN
ncbi:hypothetical protein [Clostridium septicum]|uniref:DUF3955 domain-containing protein n=1 Tax=Clostridium septicum TaxID=1504 RepID=A0A9N7JL22_CLOSE|nr:hypothetical protein [Clostridium septicum]AYE33831.1 hypothetical protein CP523_04760 [Clostridium septicum]MDU1314751.1 hypothetical protein [Clostridium septicum]QAS61977.1 hypothetical protein EI377_15270 [Clostridium septicum]UEC21557.1 hypothetical protein LK444_04070 [Clostridium septicum]USS00397.1 hypothetical protein NH397_13015 [Clostridium septicum]